MSRCCGRSGTSWISAGRERDFRARPAGGGDLRADLRLLLDRLRDTGSRQVLVVNLSGGSG
jgi:hypothetical protein